MRRPHPNPRQDVLNRARKPQRHWDISDMGLIAVRVRIVWERDGVEWVNALAKRWTSEKVWCEFPDRRLNGPGVWLEARDVRRR